MAGQEDEKSIIVAVKGTATGKFVPTGAANRERKKANLAAKKNYKKQKASKEPLKGKDDYPALDEGKVSEGKLEVKDDREIVVHPWHLSDQKHVIQGDHVILDSGRYRIADFSDNLEGERLFRRITGPGTVLLPRVWGNFHYIQEACAPLVAEALGKVDVDLKYLIPRAIVNLKTRIPVWPGVENELFEYLTSTEFTNKVQRHYTERLGKSRTILTAKCLRFAAKINASALDVEKAVDLHLGGTKLRLILWWFVMWCILTIAVGATLFHYGRLWKKDALVLFPMIGKALLFAKWLRVPPKVRQILSELEAEKFQVTYASFITIAASCSKGVVLPNLLNQWKFVLKRGHQELACQVKKAYETFGTYIRGANMAIPNACHHDQYNGLRIRFFFERTYDGAFVWEFVNTIKTLLSNGTISLKGKWKWYSEAEWLAHLPGRRRRLLEEALPAGRSVEPFIGVDIFVKLEAYLGKNWDCFKARIIQGRDVVYQKIVGPFFYSLSKWLADCFSIENGNGLIYDNGLDAVELGRLASSMFANYKYVYEIDVSNWDGSISSPMLEFEKWFLRKMVPVYWQPLREVLLYWGIVKGSGKHGVSYSTKHGRRSGDMWTSSFNSLINLMILVFIFGTQILAVAKGDDNFFGTNSDLSVSEIVAIYARLGMKAKVKRISHISKLGYCSGTFYPVDGGWKWGVKPFRILSKFGLNLNRAPEKYHHRLMYGTAISMLPIAGHVPVLGTMLRAIRNDGQARGLIPMMPEFEEWKNTSTVIHDITPECYGYFCDNYQFSVEDVDALETMVSIHVGEHRPLSISDFPIVLEDPRFFRGFAVDVDLDVVPNCSNVTVGAMKPRPSLSSMEFYILVILSPLWEEIARAHLGWYFTFWIGLVESYYYYGKVGFPFQNLVLHSVFQALHLLPGGRSIAWLYHTVWNYACWNMSKYQPARLEVDYGSLLGVLGTWCGAHSRRGAGVFTLMSDCVAPYKYRLTDFLDQTHFRWCQWVCRIKQRTKKQNSQQKPKSSKKSGGKKQKGSLGRSLLKAGLTGLGGMLGPGAAALGNQIGDWGATLLGMGDYEVKQNTLVGGQGVPMMHGDGNMIRIRHREPLGDITGSIGFVTNSYVIQPGSSETFPWLSRMAGLFQQYRFHGLAFEFISTSADALNSVNTALGSVIMATQYNVSFPDFANKAEMEQYQFSTVSRPSKSFIHFVECDPHLQVLSNLYTRTGALPAGQDYQFYDWGKFQIATVGMQAAATIGEMWVTYDVEFQKPRIASGGAFPGQFTRISNGPYDANNPLGTIQQTPRGNLGASITAGAAGFQRIFLPDSITAGRFLLTVRWLGTVAAAVSSPGRTYSNLTVQNTNFQLSSAGEVFTPAAGVNSTRFQWTVIFTVNGYNVNGSYIELDTLGTLPATPTNVDIIIEAMPLSDTAF